MVIYGAICGVMNHGEVGIDEHECMIQTLVYIISRVMNDKNISSDEQID